MRAYINENNSITITHTEDEIKAIFKNIDAFNDYSSIIKMMADGFQYQMIDSVVQEMNIRFEEWEKKYEKLFEKGE